MPNGRGGRPSTGGSAKKKAKIGDDEDTGDWKSFDSYGFASECKARRTHKKLSWSLQEPDAYSDWKIVVTRAADSEEAARYGGSAKKRKKSGASAGRKMTYHVHKNIIGVGPKKSEYFENLFNSRNDMAEHENSTSEIELEGSAFDAFPVMLDYVYSQDSDDGKASFSTKNVIALRYLAHYFQIRKLFIEATEFLDEDMTKSKHNLPTYIYESSLYGDAKLAKAAIDDAAKALSSIDSEHFLVLPPELFVKVISSEELSDDSFGVSRAVSHYCGNHQFGADSIDDVMFADMTSEKAMPSVAKECAISLLFHLEELASEDPSKDVRDNAKSLKERCAKAMSTDWRNIATSFASRSAGRARGGGRKSNNSSVDDLSESAQIELLKACLVAAEDTVVETVTARDEANSQLATKTWELQRKTRELQTKTRELQRKTGELQTKTRELQTKTRELQRFKPCPSTACITERSIHKVSRPSHDTTTLGSIKTLREYLVSNACYTAYRPLYYFE